MPLPRQVASGQFGKNCLVCFATPPPPSQRGEGVRGREEDSASSRAMTFISQNLSVLYPVPPPSPLRLSAERTIPPPYPLPSFQERRGSPATSLHPHCTSLPPANKNPSILNHSVYFTFCVFYHSWQQRFRIRTLAYLLLPFTTVSLGLFINPPIGIDG